MIDFAQTWWPPSPDDVRLQNYIRRQELFESRHAEAFSEKSGKVPDHLKDKLYLIQDYPKLISSTFADLLFGQAPVFSLPDQQEQLNKLVTSNRLSTTLYESELSASFRGDAVFKLSVGPRHPGGPNEVLIEEVPAYSYFAELDPDNGRRVVSQCLAWERTLLVREPSGGQTERRFLRVEIHQAGLIINQLYRIKGMTKVEGPVPLSELYGADAPPEEWETGVDVPLIFHFPNVRHGSCYYGMSDYTLGLESLFDEANQRITAIAAILDNHSDPRLVLPTGIVNKKGQVKAEDLKIIEVPPEESLVGLPKMLTWDPHLEACFKQLEGIEKRIFKFSDVCRVDPEGVANIDSSPAMHRLFAPMLARMALKQNYREPVICDMLYTAMMLGAANRVEGYEKPSARPEMVWRNGLPKDDKELTEVAAMAVGARFMSRKTAIRYTRQVGDQEAEAELAIIDAETPATPPAPAFGDPAANQSSVA